MNNIATRPLPRGYSSILTPLLPPQKRSRHGLYSPAMGSHQSALLPVAPRQRYVRTRTCVGGHTSWEIRGTIWFSLPHNLLSQIPAPRTGSWCNPRGPCWPCSRDTSPCARSARDWCATDNRSNWIQWWSCTTSSWWGYRCICSWRYSRSYVFTDREGKSVSRSWPRWQGLR